MNLAPIVLFVYNRPWHTQQTVEALQKNELASDSELFIYSDAPKNEDAKISVSEVREYIKSIKGFKKITIIEREKNWGLANSIIDGVTNIVNQYGKIIVLEDDLVTSPFFLKFMNEALEFYKDKEKVWHISGYTPPLAGITQDFFIKPTSCWGWATWSNRWKFFKKDSEYFVKKIDANMRKDFNVNNTYDYFSHLVLNHENKLNTWAIFWYVTTYLNEGLSLHPKKSFVQNIGHDESGTHCARNTKFNVQLATDFENSFPREVLIRSDFIKILEQYYQSLNDSMYIKLIKKIKNIIGLQ